MTLAIMVHWRWRSLLRVLVPIAAFPVFLVGALPLYTVPHRILAWAVFALGTAPALRLLARPVSVPLLELVGIQYVVFYSLPVFYHDEFHISGSVLHISSQAITVTLLSTALAMMFILIGHELARRSLRISFSWIRFQPSVSRAFVYGVFLTVVAEVLQLTGLVSAVGFGPLEVLLPRTLGLALLACTYYSGGLDRRRGVVVYALFVVSTIWGLIGGMMQLAIEPFFIWAVARFIYTRRAPVAAAVVLVGLFFILQPIKTQYRALMGAGLRSFSATEAVEVYGNLVSTLWKGIGSNADAVKAVADQSASDRLSWLQSTAWYVQLTPTMIPYRGGRTLMYPFYSLVPRAIWPDKPIAQEANKTLPVDYGLQSPSNLDKTMFGVGHVAEVYTALGLAGIMPVFLLIGVAYAIPQLMLRNSPSVVTVAMLLWLATGMMHIGSTVGNALGGVLQQILVQTILLRLMTEDRGRRRLAVAAPVAVVVN